MKQQGLISFLLFALGITAFHQFVFPLFVAKSGLNPGRYIYFVLWLAFFCWVSFDSPLKTKYGFESDVCMVYGILFLRMDTFTSYSVDFANYIHDVVVNRNLPVC